MDRWTKRCILLFPKQGRPLISQELPRYNPCIHSDQDILCSTTQPHRTKIENILRKNQNSFRRNRSTTSQILTISKILEGVRAKSLEATILFVDFAKAFDSIHGGKMEQILLAYGLPKNVAVIMMLHRNTKVNVCSAEGDKTTSKS